MLLAAGGALGAAALAFQRRGWALFLIGGWLAASILGVSAGGYFPGHYLIQALPALALAVGLGASLAGRWLGSAGLALFCVLWLGAQPWIFGMSIEEQTLRRYGYLRFVTSVDVGDFLRRAGSGSLFVLASEPQIFHYSGCRAVSPMVLMNPLLFGGYPSSRRRQEETLAGILRDLPDYMVLSFQRAGRADVSDVRSLVLRPRGRARPRALSARRSDPLRPARRPRGAQRRPRRAGRRPLDLQKDELSTAARPMPGRGVLFRDGGAEGSASRLAGDRALPAQPLKCWSTPFRKSSSETPNFASSLCF